MRIAILTNAPASYRNPVFEHLCASPGVEACVFFDSVPDPERGDDDLAYPHEYLNRGFAIQSRYYQDEAWFAERTQRQISLAYLPRLSRYRPDVIVSAEFGWRTLNAAAYALVLGVPLLVWWEGTCFTERHAGVLRSWMRRALSRLSAGLLGLGRGSVDYLETIGGDATPIHFVPQAVPNQLISAETDRWRLQRETVRDELGVRGVGLLCLSRLLPHKGIPQFF